MLQWSPKPPSGPATGACHVALLLLLTAVTPDRQRAVPVEASYLLSLLTQPYIFTNVWGLKQPEVLLCASNSLMLHL